MGKPYSDLEKRAIAILAGGGNPATSQDEAVKKYWTWKINPSSSAHDLPAASTRTANRKKDSKSILPFGVVLNAGLYATVQISKRSATAAQTAGILDDCQYKTVSNSEQTLKLKSFRPAQVYWRTGDAATSAERTSRITGRKYKSYYTAGDEGFVAPFGRDTGAETEGVRQTVIKNALASGSVKPNLVTFIPEIYRT